MSQTLGKIVGVNGNMITVAFDGSDEAHAGSPPAVVAVNTLVLGDLGGDAVEAGPVFLILLDCLVAAFVGSRVGVHHVAGGAAAAAIVGVALVPVAPQVAAKTLVSQVIVTGVVVGILRPLRIVGRDLGKVSHRVFPFRFGVLHGVGRVNGLAGLGADSAIELGESEIALAEALAANDAATVDFALGVAYRLASFHSASYVALKRTDAALAVDNLFLLNLLYSSLKATVAGEEKSNEALALAQAHANQAGAWLATAGILRSNGDDEAALSAVMEFIFHPALNYDKYVPVWVSIPITFSVRLTS